LVHRGIAFHGVWIVCAAEKNVERREGAVDDVELLGQVVEWGCESIDGRRFVHGLFHMIKGPVEERRQLREVEGDAVEAREGCPKAVDVCGEGCEPGRQRLGAIGGGGAFETCCPLLQVVQTAVEIDELGVDRIEFLEHGIGWRAVAWDGLRFRNGDACLSRFGSQPV